MEWTTASWVLLVITMWEPSMWIDSHEWEYDTMEECMERREELVRQYSKTKAVDDDFHFSVGCSPSEPEAEVDHAETQNAPKQGTLNQARPPYQMDPWTFDLTCKWMTEALGYAPNCTQIPPPYIVESASVNEWNAMATTWGMYFPPDYVVFINPDTPHALQTVIHETVHYIQWQLHLPITRCEGEELARAVSGGPWNERLAKAYSCEWVEPLPAP